ncbi:ATPase [Colwellia sp. Arc7-D]|nr:ATPase [Colwellia sp. Arc7-D]
MGILIFIGICFVIYKIFSSSKPKSKVQTKSPRTKTVITQNSPQVHSSNRNVEDDDNLATFTISHGYEEEESKNKSPGRWISENETVEINGKVLSKGNFYYGGILKALDTDSSYFSNQETEASLVDDTLKVEDTNYLFTDDSLGYWPKYITLSPKARGAYIDWLFSSRNDPATSIGYVFIYFYGIERRVTVDAAQGTVDDIEYKAIFNEVLRLKSIYGDSRSFSNYASRLLELMCLVRPEIVYLSPEDYSLNNNSLLFKFNLATSVSKGEPISPEIALAWTHYYPEYSLRTPARRCNDKFAQLFKSKYVEKYIEGFVVKPNKTKLDIEYWPASNTISGVTIDQKELPDPSMLKGPTKKLIAIADACTDELEAYSRYLGKKGTSSNDVAAILLLPDELINENSSSFISNFKVWANAAIQGDAGLVSVSDFWAQMGISLPEKINKKELELIQNIATKAGFGIAPDSRYHNAKPSLDGKLVLFTEGHGEYFEPSKAFNDIGMALRLGAMVANIDSHLDEDELNVLHQLINHDIKISPTEKKSLHAYLTWRLNSPANMNGLKARLEKLDTKAKSVVSHILLTVALADGKIDPSEIKQLEKLYVALGLDKSLVTSDIHNVSSSKSSSLVPKEQSRTLDKTGFTLDEELLALHESETSEVQSMLGAIFVDEEPPQKEEPILTTSNQAVSILDASHNTLYQELIVKDQWARKEVIELCQKLGLMVDGAIETINDWSFDVVDAPVLDDDDDIYIDLEIVEELKG